MLLLYTFSGYHDGQQGCFVRLRDSAGHQWLPSFIDMSFQPKVAGHQPVGEVFFPPVGITAVPTDLFVMHDTWEVWPESYLQVERAQGYSLKSLGKLQPEPVAQLPDWFFFNFAHWSWEKYEHMGGMMQMLEATKYKQYGAAVSIGESVLKRSQRDDNPFFFTKSRLLLGLYFAHKGVGDLRIARSYLDKAIVVAKEEPGQMSEFYRDIAVACKQEKITLPNYLVE